MKGALGASFRKSLFQTVEKGDGLPKKILSKTVFFFHAPNATIIKSYAP